MHILHIVVLYATKTDRLLLTYTDEAGQKLQDTLNEEGPGEVYYVHCDVTNEGDVKVIKP